MRIQCPACFEQIEIHAEAVRSFPSRRCPNGISKRQNAIGYLGHCYCKNDSKHPSCCKCGDVFIRKSG